MPKTPEFIFVDRFTGFALDSATGMLSGEVFVTGEGTITRNPSGTYVIQPGHFGYTGDPNNDGNLEDPPVFPPQFEPPEGAEDNVEKEDVNASTIIYPEGGGAKSDVPMCMLDSVRSCLFQGSFDDSCSMNKIMLHGLNGGILLDQYSNAPATSIMWPAVRGDECGTPTDRIMDIGDSDFKFNQINAHTVKAYGTALTTGFVSDHFQYDPDGGAATNMVIVGKSGGLKFHASSQAIVPTGANTRSNADNFVDLGTSQHKFKRIHAYQFMYTPADANNWSNSGAPTHIAQALDRIAAALGPI